MWAIDFEINLYDISSNLINRFGNLNYINISIIEIINNTYKIREFLADLQLVICHRNDDEDVFKKLASLTGDMF